MKTIVTTGHRHFGDRVYWPDGALWAEIEAEASAFLLKYRAKYADVGVRLVSGFAVGWDQCVAAAALRLGIPVHPYLPFSGQEKKWPAASQARYYSLLSQSEVPVTTGSQAQGKRAFHIRNHVMCDLLQPDDCLFSCWNGSDGGTSSCVKYAMSLQNAYVRRFPLFDGGSTPARLFYWVNIDVEHRGGPRITEGTLTPSLSA